VLENRVLRRIFGPKRDEVTGGWRKLHNEEIHNLYPSQSIIRIIKLRRMRCAGNVARMGRRLLIQGAAEITPTFQRGITNKWYEISPKTLYFPNVDITKFFYFRF
jgi:hypothetical protein